jgi:hypothetical protein
VQRHELPPDADFLRTVNSQSSIARGPAAGEGGSPGPLSAQVRPAGADDKEGKKEVDMLPAIASALSGLAAHQRLLEDSARRIARIGRPPPAEPVDLARESVQIMVARTGYEANLRTIKVADEMLGTLLDVLA